MKNNRSLSIAQISRPALASDATLSDSDALMLTQRVASPRILQVLPALVMGGVERGTLDTAQALAQGGFQSFVASSGGPMERELTRNGSTHFDLPMHRKAPWSILANASRLIDLARRQKIDLIHARSRAPAWAALIATRRCKLPFITTFHGTYRRNSPFKNWYNGVMVKGDKVIAISEFIAHHITQHYRIDPSRITVIPRGVDEAIFDPALVTQERMIALAQVWRVRDGAPIIMLPARFSRWKGHLTLLDAFRRMNNHDSVLVFVGSADKHGSFYQEVERRIAEHGLGERVRLGGECRDMAAAYALSDVVVSASLQPEAFGRVCAEASAMARLVVATDHGGSRETILHKQSGYLVPPGDVTALAQALDQALMTNFETRKQMGHTGRAHILAKYTKKRMTAATLALYEKALAENKRGR
ncbi:MAG: glycosyltransferase family 4 protein [Alphaproteobacteria bacterium]|nr:glycosyltransferase family 4 protein [Alphaproteobacteria bacterium]